MQHILTDEEYRELQLKVTNAEQAVQHANKAHVMVVDAILPLDEVKSKYVRIVVDHCKGNVSEAATILDVHRQTVAMLLKESEPNPNPTRCVI